MKKVVFLDTGVLGIVVHPRSEEGRRCQAWLRDLLAAGVRVCIPEICDYELRRKLKHIGSTRSLANLDRLKTIASYLSIVTPAMVEAADLWADARRRGVVTAPPEALDGDVILCAQARRNAGADEAMIVATTNVADISNFAPAAGWEAISA